MENGRAPASIHFSYMVKAKLDDVEFISI